MTTTKDVQRMDVSIDAGQKLITIKIPTQADVALHLNRLHADNISYAALYGIGVRITRAAALPSGSTWAEKRAAMQELIEHLESGSPEWSAARQSGSRIGSDEVLLARALQEIYTNKTPERVREYVHGLTKAQRLAVAQTEQVREILDRMRAEETKEINGEDLLAAL